MDIKPQNQSSGASSAPTQKTSSLGPSSLFSQIVVRTMLQDLAEAKKTAPATAKKTPVSAVPAAPEPAKDILKTSPAIPLPPPPPLAASKEADQGKKKTAEKIKLTKEEKKRLKKEEEEKAKKAREEREAKAIREKEGRIKLAEQEAKYFKDLQEAYQKGRSLAENKLFKEASVELAKITSDQKAGWWLKLKAQYLAGKAQKQLDKALVSKPAPTPIPLKTTPAPAKPITAEPFLADIEAILQTTETGPKIMDTPMPATQPIKTAAPPPDLPSVAPTPATTPTPAQATAPTPVLAPAPTPAPKPETPPSGPIKSAFVSLSLDESPTTRPIPLPPGSLSDFRATGRFTMKKWMWILGGAVILLLIIIPITLFIFSGQPGASPQASATPSPSVSVKPTPQPPVALFEMNSRQTLEVQAGAALTAEKINTLAQTDETVGNFVQVLIKITDSNNEIRYADLGDAAELLHLSLFAPTASMSATSSTNDLIDYLKIENYSLFVYSQQSNVPSAPNASSSPFDTQQTSTAQNQGRAGLVVALKDTASSSAVYLKLKTIETTLAQSLINLFFGKEITISANSVFLDGTYKNIAIRYLNVPKATLSIDYAVINNFLVFTTSKDSMYAAIDRILEKTNATPTPTESAGAPTQL